MPDPTTATSEHEHGRAYVLCICGAMYWYAAVDVLNEPNSEARVRAATTRIVGRGGISVPPPRVYGIGTLCAPPLLAPRLSGEGTVRNP
jgi:hypothetical protein